MCRLIKAPRVDRLAAIVAEDQLHVLVVRNMIIAAFHATVDMSFLRPLAEDIFACVKEPHGLLVDNVVGEIECHSVLDDVVKIPFNLCHTR
jgi:hypothetical protein